MKLNTLSNFHHPGVRSFRDYEAGDDFYEALISMHLGLNDEESAQANARLVLLLANHIGDLDVLLEAMQIARQSASSTPDNNATVTEENETQSQWADRTYFHANLAISV